MDISVALIVVVGVGVDALLLQYQRSPCPTPRTSSPSPTTSLLIYLSVCTAAPFLPHRLMCQFSERMARSWWASKKVSELELETPLTVTPSVTIQVSFKLVILMLAPACWVLTGDGEQGYSF